MMLPDSLDYWRAFLRAAPLGDVVRAAVRRIGRSGGLAIPEAATSTEARLAAEALCSAPRLFTPAPTARALYRLLFPESAATALARAESILRHEIDIFGAPIQFGPRLDWHHDPRTGHAFDETASANELDMLRAGGDPKGPWELARCAHLVELGVAAALHPELLPAARAEIFATITSFLDDNPLGHGLHWTSPLEVALRSVSWMSAIDLVGGLVGGRNGGLAGSPSPEANPVESDLDRARFARRLGGALVENARFLSANLEDRGAVAGNHLIGDLVGLFTIALRLGNAADAPLWRGRAHRLLVAEAARQVEPDGADFEASTGYHRFVLEMLLAADQFARAHEFESQLSAPLSRMFRFVAGYLGPDGREPGFGDGDDGRCLALCARHPRDHAYLLSIGAGRFSDPRDPALRLRGTRFSEEAVWLTGAAGYRAFRALPEGDPPRARSFPEGGVHVLQDRGTYAALRCGGYGQKGVGGHAHNDQLSVVVSLSGQPLVVDAGTFCYASDPVWRDRFRGTAAHSTVSVEGKEQSPIFDGRPFALPDGAGARIVQVEDDGTLRLVGRHEGYRRLLDGVTHEREVRLDPATGAVLITDQLTGRGSANACARFLLGDAVPTSADAAVRARISDLAARADWARTIDPAFALALARDGRVFAVIAPMGDTSAPRLERGWWSPFYGTRLSSTVACFDGCGDLPMRLSVAMFLIEG